MTPIYPGPTLENLANIPRELTVRDQWILWRGADRIDQKTGLITLNKIPINPQLLTNADSTDPTTWGTFAQCVAALPLALEEWETTDPVAFRGGGIGYVVSENDPYAGIDLDHCVHPDTGAIEPWAQAHIDALASYTEITPSGTGLHMWVQGTLPPKGRKKGLIEMYTHARFFTMTGWHLDTTPVTCEPRQIALTALWCSVFGVQVGDTVWLVDKDGVITNKPHNIPWTITAITAHTTGELYAWFTEMSGGWPAMQCEQASPHPQPTPSPLCDDAALIAKMLSASNGEKIRRLAQGDWQQTHTSESEADLGFCIHCAFYTQDAAQIDRTFRTTALMRPKWDAPRGASTWGAGTIKEALARQTEHYHGSPLSNGAYSDPFAQNGTTVASTPVASPWMQRSGTRAVFDFSTALPATELMQNLFLQQPRFLVEKLIPDGLTILGAPAKSYKSIFAMSLALATIGEGDWCDTFPVESTGPVVFFGLEAPPMQLRNRLHQLRPSYQPDSPAYPLIFFSGMKALPTFKEGLQDAIAQIIERYQPRLLIIDPLSYLYRLGRQDDLASATLDLLWPLAEMAAAAKISIFAPEHMRKRSKEDVSVMDQLNGSYIKAAVVHGLLLLRREGEDLIIETIMRDAQSQELAITVDFDEQGHRIQWGYKGANAGVREARTTALKAQVLEEVRERGYPMKVAEVMDALVNKGLVKNTTQTRDNIRQILYRAEQAGDLAVSKRGEYYWIGTK
jgi:putative DNA primase/helicase